MEKMLGIYKAFWVKGADYQGQTSRNDFWIALWWNAIVYILIMAYIMAYKQRTGAIFGLFVLVVYTLAFIVPVITLIARRYNDLGLPKYWLLLTLILPIILLVLSGVIGSVACKIIAEILIVISLIILMLPKDEFTHQQR